MIQTIIGAIIIILVIKRTMNNTLKKKEMVLEEKTALFNTKKKAPTEDYFIYRTKLYLDTWHDDILSWEYMDTSNYSYYLNQFNDVKLFHQDGSISFETVSTHLVWGERFQEDEQPLYSPEQTPIIQWLVNNSLSIEEKIKKAIVDGHTCIDYNIDIEPSLIPNVIDKLEENTAYIIEFMEPSALKINFQSAM